MARTKAAQLNVNSTLVLIYAAGALTTILAAGLAAAGAARRGLRIGEKVSWTVIAFSLYLPIAQLFKLCALRDYADFAVWKEIVHNIAGGKGAWSSLQNAMMPGTGHWYAAHFTPLINVFAISGLAGPLAVNLLVAQFLGLSAAILGVYLYAKLVLGACRLALAAAALLVLYPTYQYIQLNEFEMLRFCIPLLILTFWALESGRVKLYWPLLIASLLVREEVGITVAMLGVYTVLFMPARRRIGAMTAAAGLLYFLVVFRVVMPSFRTAGANEYVAAYWLGDLGRTIPQVVVGIVTRPGLVIKAIAQPVKLANLFMYLLPLSLVPLAGGWVLLIGAGNVALNLLSNSVEHTSYFLYYLSPAIPFVFVALVKGVKRLGAWLEHASPLRDTQASGADAVLCGVFAGALVANLFFGPSPISFQFWFRGYKLAPLRTLNFNYREYEVTRHDRELKRVLAAVPIQAVVSAEQHLLPPLADRAGLRVFPDLAGADWVVIDKKRREKTGTATVPGSWDGLRRHPQTYYDLVEKDPHWQLVVSDDGYYVYGLRGAADGYRTAGSISGPRMGAR